MEDYARTAFPEEGFKGESKAPFKENKSPSHFIPFESRNSFFICIWMGFLNIFRYLVGILAIRGGIKPRKTL